MKGLTILYTILKTVSLLPPVSVRVRRVLQTARLKNVTAETAVDAMPFLCAAAANDQCSTCRPNIMVVIVANWLLVAVTYDRINSAAYENGRAVL